MKEKVFAVVFRMLPERWKQVEDFLDSIGATVIFVKQTDVNRKLVVKNRARAQLVLRASIYCIPCNDTVKFVDPIF